MIKVFIDALQELSFSSINFPGGEPHITLDKPKDIIGRQILIDARLRDAEEFLTFVLLTTAIQHYRPSKMTLFLPYVPGGRMDRIPVDSGNGFTLKMYANIINSLHFDQVTTIDPHSDVTLALINNCYQLPVAPFIYDYITEIDQMNYIISPDAGAAKRNKSLVTHFNRAEIVASKTRNTTDGSLTGFKLPELPGPGNYVVIDDLCDGGGTFIGLAEEFRKVATDGMSLHLWTTHGIYSKGLRTLLSYYDTIGSTDSFDQMYSDKRYIKLKLDPFNTRVQY